MLNFHTFKDIIFVCSAMVSGICMAQVQLGTPTPTSQPNIVGTPNTLESCFAHLTQPPTGLTICDNGLKAAYQSITTNPIVIAHYHAALSALNLHSNDLLQARSHIESAQRSAPDDPIVLGNYANLRLREGAYVEAEEIYSQLLMSGLDADDLQLVYLNRSLARRAQGQYEEANMDFSRYVSLKDSAASDRHFELDQGPNRAPASSAMSVIESDNTAAGDQTAP